MITKLSDCSTRVPLALFEWLSRSDGICWLGRIFAAIDLLEKSTGIGSSSAQPSREYVIWKWMNGQWNLVSSTQWLTTLESKSIHSIEIFHWRGQVMRWCAISVWIGLEGQETTARPTITILNAIPFRRTHKKGQRKNSFWILAV